MSSITWTGPELRRVNRPARVPDAAPATSPARLTRRGRLVVAALLLGVTSGLVLSLPVVATTQATATNERGSTAVAERVTVRPGETLWGIAERVRPDADPRATIARIRDMNGLASSAAQAGQVLLVPAG